MCRFCKWEDKFLRAWLGVESVRSLTPTACCWYRLPSPSLPQHGEQEVGRESKNADALSLSHACQD